jgi:chromosome segregation protein
VAGERARLQEAIQAVQERKLRLEAGRTELERNIKADIDTQMNTDRELSRIEQRRQAAEFEEGQIIDRLLENYRLSRTQAGELRTPMESLTKTNRRIAELRREMDALGTPNLGAIEEYKRVHERYSFLTAQREDAAAARAELLTMIGEIADRMKDTFLEQFAIINQKFGETFADIFGGGQAALELEDPDDVLNCGIAIKAQPPGKVIKYIAALSGGERALVAIALYFAVLKAHPTPFCVLDEIDAALDDVNVSLFAAYLARLSAGTQFIVITHRRGTMEAADRLYGVTMQEKGVSKVLALNVREIEEEMVG